MESRNDRVFHIYVANEGRIVCGRACICDWLIRDDWSCKLPVSELCPECAAAVRRPANGVAA